MEQTLQKVQLENIVKWSIMIIVSIFIVALLYSCTIHLKQTLNVNTKSKADSKSAPRTVEE